MPTDPPDFATLARLEDAALSAKLQAVRAVIAHAGEKGRALEEAVMGLLRDILPAEYGLSTGFIAYHDDETVKLSPQLDIIIYDAVRTGPLTKFTACDVFPLEAVHGYVEVKASLCSSSDDAETPARNSIEHCLQQNRELRRMVQRRFHVRSPGNQVRSGRERRDWIAIRGFVVAFEPEGTIASDHGAFAQRMADASDRLGQPTHLHGVFIANHGYFRTRPVDPKTARDEDMWHVEFVQGDGLSAFKADLLHGLARFPRFPPDWTPALGDYFVTPSWETRAPSGGQGAAQQSDRADGTGAS